MRRALVPIVSAAILVASAVLLSGGRLSLQPPGAAAQTEAPAQVGSWLVTLTDQSSQTTPVFMSLTADGTLVAGELPVPSGALLPGPSEAPGASPGESPVAVATEQPLATELPATPSGLLNSPGHGLWTAVSDTDLIFTYVVLQSDQAGTFVAKVTVSGAASLDDTGDAISGTYAMRFVDPNGADLGSSSGTLQGDRIKMALIAAFDASQVAGSLDVAFTDKSTGDPTNWNWDFGDGSLSADQSPTHTYDQQGDYTVTLTVTNDQQETATVSQTVTVSEVSTPTADFNTAQTAGTLEVKFTDQSTGGPNTWSWNFGDGKTGSKQNPKHTYAKPGNYKVTLKVSNAAGSDTTTHTVNVAKPPTAGFSITQAPGSFEVKFTDASKGSPDTWSWDFGDGTAGNTHQNPRHTYDKAGTYQVKLTVTNNGGTDSHAQSVTVPAPSPSESPAPSESTAP
jgi:PKD repeat protein